MAHTLVLMQPALRSIKFKKFLRYELVVITTSKIDQGHAWSIKLVGALHPVSVKLAKLSIEKTLKIPRQFLRAISKILRRR